MELQGKLKQGMSIFGVDNREYGTIDRYDDQYAYVGQRRIPVSAVERMDQDRLYVGQAGARYFADDAQATIDDGEIRVPIVEERLEVEKRQGEVGSVDIRKDVTSERVNIPVELRHEEVSVNRVDVPDRPLAAGDLDDAFEEGTIRVPVRGEEAIVDKHAVVTGEVVVDKELRTERQAVTETVRRDEVTIDHTKDAPVRHRQGHVPHRDER